MFISADRKETGHVTKTWLVDKEHRRPQENVHIVDLNHPLNTALCDEIQLKGFPLEAAVLTSSFITAE